MKMLAFARMTDIKTMAYIMLGSVACRRGATYDMKTLPFGIRDKFVRTIMIIVIARMDSRNISGFSILYFFLVMLNSQGVGILMVQKD